MVTKTFQLTVNGTVPNAGEFLYARFSPRSPDPAQTGFAHFCGPLFQIDTKPACQGNGTVYTERVTFPAGTTVTFSFERSNQATSTSDTDPYEIEVIAQGSETLTSDLTNRATYTYTGAMLPDTGLRASAGWAGAVGAVAILLLTTGLYLQRRAA